MPQPKIPEVYVLSSGRSGTTLLSSMLNASKQIWFPLESDFIARAYPFFSDSNNLASPESRKAIIKLFKRTTWEKGWHLSEECLNNRLNEQKPQNFREIYSVICQTFHEKNKTAKLKWGIKSPVLISSLNRIFSICPNAKIIHIIRDGRDVYISYKKIHEKSKTSDIKEFDPKGIVSSALY